MNDHSVIGFAAKPCHKRMMNAFGKDATLQRDGLPVEVATVCRLATRMRVPRSGEVLRLVRV